MNLFAEDELALMLDMATSMPVEKIPECKRTLQAIMQQCFTYIDFCKKAIDILDERAKPQQASWEGL